jgi:hypothetical protein
MGQLRRGSVLQRFPDVLKEINYSWGKNSRIEEVDYKQEISYTAVFFLWV